MDFKRPFILGAALGFAFFPAPFSAVAGPSPFGMSQEETMAIAQQLDHDRRAQKTTKDLKIKLEQTNLELEEEKALAEINKLKKENGATFNEPVWTKQNNLPEIKVDYIGGRGGDKGRKEAILSIGGVSYQVKEKTSPVANIEVVHIGDEAVTLHFGTPLALTKTFDFKPQ